MIGTQSRVIKIPAHSQWMNRDNSISKKRVAAYTRVSTFEETQDSSFSLQVEHYTKFIQSNEEWEFAGIYADRGKSGTSTEKRAEFLRMIEDCRAGKIDLVITKSISRFARNTLDCLNYVRELKRMNPPVGVYFEKENLDTLDSKTELILTILSSISQEEARSISDNLKWSIRKGFQEGKPKCPTYFLLGYDTDEDGNMVINEEQAAIVRRIYREYMEGKGITMIKKGLIEDGIPSIRSGWGKTSIARVLKNERYCGDVVMQKKFVEDFLTHKQKENKGQLPQYYIRDHHPAIIPRDEWDAVQQEIKRRHENATRKEKQLRQGYSSASVLSNRLYCGHCGQPLIQRTTTINNRKDKIKVFKCRASFAKERNRVGCEPCHAQSRQERKIKEAFMEMLIKLSRNREEIETLEDREFLLEILGEIDENSEFQDSYFRGLVERGTLHDDGRLIYEFKNGFVCTSYVKRDERARNIKKTEPSSKERKSLENE